MKIIQYLILMIVFVATLFACSAEVVVPSISTSPSPEPDKIELNDPEEPVLALVQSGGLAGVAYQWVLYADGRIEASTGRYQQATSEQVDQLLSEIETLGFFDLDSRYIPLNTCCDRFVYELSVRSEGREHSLAVLEASPDVPKTVWDLLNTVSSFFDAHRK